MTIGQRVRRTQGALVVATAIAVVAWATLMGVTVVVVAGVFDAWIGLARPARVLIVPAAFVSAMAVAAFVVGRNRGVWSTRQVALWIETQQPALSYGLVTALDPRTASLSRALEPVVAPVRWNRAVARTFGRVVGRPAIGLVPALMILAFLPDRVIQRVTTPQVGDVLGGPAETGIDAIAPIVVSIEPPSYTLLPPEVLEEPRTVSGIEGSRVTVRGSGSAADLSAQLGDTSLPVRTDGREWLVEFVMGANPIAMMLSRAGVQRVLGVEPVRDSLPLVVLVRPERDTVMRVATGLSALQAAARDDFGVRSLWIEYIVSAGQGESYDFRSGVLERRIGDGTVLELSYQLLLDSLGLGPGDIVHLRAVAHDNHDITGPGRGVSETRSLRVARSQEYDSISIEVLPPVAADSSLLSQRLLIMLVEALVEQRGALASDVFTIESRRLGQDQAALRRQVAEVIFIRLTGESGEHEHEGEVVDDLSLLTPQEVLRAAEAATDEGAGEALDFHGDETPVVAINRPLLEAYNSMWDAATELNLGDPDAALPYMYAALEAIQRARAAERIYLRGLPPRIVIDLDRVRLAGDSDGLRAAARRAASADPADRYADRLLGAITLLARGSAEAADSLLLLRIESMATHPALAAALGDVLEALDRGGDVTDGLIRARRTILDPPAHRGLGLWGHIP